MNPTQQEQLLNIGAYLKDVRKEKGKAIDEVANQIFIRPALVRAIEAGDWESLPEPVFVQGFIRRYAEYLGLDGKEVSRKFEPTPVSVLPNPDLATSGSVEGVVKQEDKHGLKVLSKAEPTPNGPTLSPAPRPGRRGGGNLAIVLVAIAALIGLIAWLTTRNTPRPATSLETPEEQVDAATTEADSAPTESDEATESSADSEPAAEGLAAVTESADAPVAFAVDIESDAWMRIVVDGNEVYEGILTAGTQESWTAQDEMRITAGNSGGVQYSFNGSQEGPLGSPGAVTNLTLTADTDPESLSTP